MVLFEYGRWPSWSTPNWSKSTALYRPDTSPTPPIAIELISDALQLVLRREPVLAALLVLALALVLQLQLPRMLLWLSMPLKSAEEQQVELNTAA
jgi:hypothetical protein